MGKIEVVFGYLVVHLESSYCSGLSFAKERALKSKVGDVLLVRNMRHSIPEHN